MLSKKVCKEETFTLSYRSRTEEQKFRQTICRSTLVGYDMRKLLMILKGRFCR